MKKKKLTLELRCVNRARLDHLLHMEAVIKLQNSIVTLQDIISTVIT